MSFHLQARSKRCLIDPAITKLSDGDLGAGSAIQWGLRAQPQHPNALSKTYPG